MTDDDIRYKFECINVLPTEECMLVIKIELEIQCMRLVILVVVNVS